MLANLHVVTGRPVDMSKRIRRLYEIPRISSFLPPLNLKHKQKDKQQNYVIKCIKKLKYISTVVCVLYLFICTVPDNKVVHTELWERLPGLDKAHLGLD